MDRQPTAAMLVIGDEILSGRTQDANAHHLAQVMTEIGVALTEIRVVPDAQDRIVEAVRQLSQRYDHVFTSGGIGPTHDDITADAVAAAFDRPIDVREDAKAILLKHYGADAVNAARMRMARIPDGAALIENPVSQAPGFIVENVHVMAGVPMIFEAMLAGLRSRLRGGPPTLSWSIRALVPEGDLAADLGALDAAHPAVTIGCYPFFKPAPNAAPPGESPRQGSVGANLVLRSTDRAALTAAAEAARAVLAARDVEIEETPPSEAGGG